MHGGQAPGAAPEIVSVIADRVTVEECREAGPAYVGNCFWERIGIDDVLKEAGLSAKARLLNRPSAKKDDKTRRIIFKVFRFDLQSVSHLRLLRKNVCG